MANLTGKVKGITFRYAKANIYDFHENDLLKLIPDPNNPYDKNAIAIYDSNGHHIGYVGKEINREVLDILKNKDYTCKISRVYYDFNTPSIEYTIMYFDKNVSNEVNPYDIFDDVTDFSSNDNKNYDESIRLATPWNNNVDFNSIIDEAISLIERHEYKEAITLLDTYSTYHNSEMLFYEGWAYYCIGQNNSLKAALRLLKKSYELGHLYASYGVGQVLFTLEKYDECYKWLKLAADNGIIDAYNNLGHCYYNGLGVEIDYDSAFQYYKKAADEGISEGLFNVARCYEDGEGTSQNFRKAEEYYRKAIELNNYDALYNLGLMYYDGKIGSKKEINDLNKSLNCFLKYIDSCPNDYSAYDYVGMIYYQQGNYEMSIKFLIKAFDGGQSFAAFQLGLVYGELNNMKESKKWLKRALESGIDQAKYYLNLYK